MRLVSAVCNAVFDSKEGRGEAVKRDFIWRGEEGKGKEERGILLDIVFGQRRGGRNIKTNLRTPLTYMGLLLVFLSR